MERVRAKKGWSWNKWANEAGIGASTTLTRAVKDDYKSITSIDTLDALARAAKVPSVLDFLSGNETIPSEAAPAEPAPELVASLLADLAPLWPSGPVTDQSLRALAQALSYGLGLLEADPANAASPREIRLAARAAIDRFGSTERE